MQISVGGQEATSLPTFAIVANVSFLEIIWKFYRKGSFFIKPFFQDDSSDISVASRDFGFDAKTSNKIVQSGELGVELKVLMPGNQTIHILSSAIRSIMDSEHPLWILRAQVCTT